MCLWLLRLQIDNRDLFQDQKVCQVDYLRPSSEDYCNKYEQRYGFFCKGEPGAGSDPYTVASFCPSFEAACVTSKTNMEQKRNLLSPNNESPCRPDCNRKIHPHCTPLCKCEYLFPLVKRHCRSPYPFFRDTCKLENFVFYHFRFRLWYRSCPKFDQFRNEVLYETTEKEAATNSIRGRQAGAVSLDRDYDNFSRIRKTK